MNNRLIKLVSWVLGMQIGIGICLPLLFSYTKSTIEQEHFITKIKMEYFFDELNKKCK